MWPICNILPPLIDGWWKNGHHLERGMSTAKYRNFHLFVLINILSQSNVPFSETYSAVLQKADHPHSSVVHEFGTVFFGRKIWSSSEISIIQVSSGGLFKTKDPFWNFVCLLPWFYQMILSLNDYKTAGAGWGLPKEQGPHIKIKWSLYCWWRYKKAAGLIQQRV